MMATPDDLVHCPVCLEVYEQPRALPCLHTFCSTCIQEYINAAARATSAITGFECPVCRRHTVPPGSADLSEWSSLFPLNHIIVSLLDSRTNQNTENLRKDFGALKRNADSDEIQADVTSSRSQDAVTSTDPPRSSVDTSKGPPDDFEIDFEKVHENYPEHDEEEGYWPLPPEGAPPHWGPPPHGPHFRHCHPPPPHHGPPGHWHPPHHRPPGHGPPPHWPPPPHHRGRGCHRPGGRFHHPHGPRHRHHGPWRGGPP